MSLIRKGDTVEVITGKYKRERGEVLTVLPKKDKVIVEGINVRVKHEKMRADQSGAQMGGRVEVEAPIHVSNVKYVFTKDRDSAPVRLGIEIKEDGTKVRVVRGGKFAGEVVD